MNKAEKHFIKTLYGFYEGHGRYTLPWRKTTDIYAIWVSEIMLQQTQVSRVLEKYAEWMKVFPDIGVLANASLQEVLFHWQGLGYSRRAKFLHQSAKVLSEKYGKVIPKKTTVSELESLPGVGLYTARAVKTFSCNESLIFIETNIRTVYIHHFFRDRESVSDREIVPLIERTIDKENPRQFYSALMDYGSCLKKSGIKNTSKSIHYTKQSPFKGSGRELRAQIVKTLVSTDRKTLTLEEIASFLQRDKALVEEKIEELLKESFIQKKRGGYSIAE